MWSTAMLASGEAVSSERYEGTLELLIAAPTPAALVVVGKVLATTALSLVAVPLTLAVAASLGLPLAIAHPALFVIALIALTASTAAIGLVFASAFMLARSTRIFQNSIGFPLWIVSGIAFPISVLPEAIRPLSAFSALAWCVAALRAAAGDPGDAWWVAIGATATLSAVYAVFGARLFIGVERRVRVDGSLSTF
jgi:ABC-2 type transport system permease protein